MSKKCMIEDVVELSSQVPESHEEAGFALQVGTLDLLARIVEMLGVRRVFEFGSGRSTRVFLENGCEVTSLEDSSQWLEDTRQSLGKQLCASWKSRCEDLQTVKDGLSAFWSWRLDDKLCEELKHADCVLIDSPAYPPSRELPLLQTLRSGCKGLIVVDDLRIPTLRRRVEAIAAASEGVNYRFLDREHGLGVLQRDAATRNGVRTGRSALEVVKSLRRYFLAKRQ